MSFGANTTALSGEKRPHPYDRSPAHRLGTDFLRREMILLKGMMRAGAPEC
jgi:hypothetical protein